jgi:putative RNA 2'-phosphotransferase
MRDLEISRHLSYVLRHRPDSIGIVLDAGGWVLVDDLLSALVRTGVSISRAQLERVVAENEKQRFALSGDGMRIRASQGHSVPVQLGYQTAEPPEILYHGTVARFLEAIRRDGLHRGRRHHVHLSADRSTATVVGARRGEAVVLNVRASEMHRSGHRFFRSANGVWLTDAVPAEYIIFTDTTPGSGERD